MADFLGDPKFPDKAMKVPRGLKIRYFQDLYKQYSRLSFTHNEDRPFAIEGLENRLRAAYHTTGGYAIFDDGPGQGLFHRSLLWQRGKDEPPPGLLRIIFPPERNITVPSWSWRAYKGGIDYLEPPFEKTDWEKTDIQPPWTTSNFGPRHSAEKLDQDARTELVAIVRDFNVAGSRPGEARLVYDVEKSRSDGIRVQCVVVAKSRDGKSDKEQTHYVLIVAARNAQGASGDRIYERVGAGFMLGKFITLKEPGVLARVQ